MNYGSLLITQATGQPTTMALDKPTVRIGRGDDNDLVLNDNRASRNHAEILCDPDGLKILDLGSANGTYVDGARLLGQFPELLNEGSTIQIGGTRMRVSLATAPPARRNPGETQVDSPNVGLLEGLLSAPLSQPKVTPPLNLAPARPPAASPTPPQSELSNAGLHIALGAQELSVEAGAAVAYTVAVTNRSEIVDSIGLEVGGIPASWVTITPAEVRLFPGNKDEIQVLVRPPKASASKAGNYDLTFTGRSAQRPDRPVKTAGILVVLPFYSDRIELEPKKQSGWLGAPYRLRLINEGNAPQQYDLEGVNDESAMRFRFNPPVGRVEAGEVGPVQVRAGVRAWRIIGQPRTFQFQITASPTEGSLQPISVPASFVHDPPFPPWLVPLLLGILLLTCCITLFVFGDPLKVALGLATPNPTGPTEQGVGSSIQTALATLRPVDANQQGTAAAAAQQTANALGIAQQQTSDALGVGMAETVGALNQTAEAASQGNAQTQTSFALSTGPTMTAIGLAFGGTQTAMANSLSQMQTTQALSATFVAQTQTALASAFANASDAQKTAFALTQTIESLHVTQTALSAPSPTPTATPQAYDRAIQLQPNGTPLYPGRTELRGDEFATSQDMTVCMYDSHPPGPPPAAANDQQVSQGGLTLSISDIPDSVSVNNDLTYTIDFSDNSEGAYLNTSMTLTPSAELTITSLTPSAGTCSISGRIATCNASYVRNVTISVRAQARSTGQAQMRVSVNASDGYHVNATVGVAARTTIYTPATPIPGLPDCGMSRLMGSSREMQSLYETAPFQVRPIFYPAMATGGASPFAILTADRGAGSYLGYPVAVINFQRNVADVKVSIFYPQRTFSQYVMAAFDEAGQVVGGYMTNQLNVPARYDLTIRSQNQPIRQVVIYNQSEGQAPLLITGVEIRYTDSLIRP